ncbi:MAG TPA: hypothetical protein VHB51_04340 [Candidatus Saccharimonadales bacterium]|nr:hypothetical protein [Candidatus Saccharimonadales bacterium]
MQKGPNDLTNKQLLGAMTEQLNIITDNMVTKDEFKTELAQLRSETKAEFARLEHKIDEGQAINVRHHLATREMIGEINRKPPVIDRDV